MRCPDVKQASNGAWNKSFTFGGGEKTALWNWHVLTVVKRWRWCALYSVPSSSINTAWNEWGGKNKNCLECEIAALHFAVKE